MSSSCKIAPKHSEMTTTLRAGDFNTNRPPKGDRSEGFYIKISIFIDFFGFGANFTENHVILYGNLVVIRQD